MQGYRKVMVALIIIGVAALVPLNAHQAEVLVAVAVATLGANAAVHVGGKIAEALGKRTGNDAGSPAALSGPEEKPWDEGAGSGAAAKPRD